MRLRLAEASLGMGTEKGVGPDSYTLINILSTLHTSTQQFIVSDQQCLSVPTGPVL